MKLISWNVNGLRAVLRKNFLDYLAKERPDVLCLQETRTGPNEVEQLWPAAYTTYWNVAGKRGYSGTAIFSRPRPFKVACGIGCSEHDREGRVLTAQYPDFFLVNVYVPNSQRELTRLAYRQSWDKAFLRYLKKLEKRKPVVFCGDLNVAHTELDLANPKANVRNHGFTAEERAGFGALVAAGFVPHLSRVRKEWRALHLVEPHGRRPRAECRLANRLLPRLRRPAPAPQMCLHPVRNDGLGPLSCGN